MVIEGMPMPCPITDTRRPWNAPVYPYIARTSLTRTAPSRNRSAMCAARSGSPGMSTTSAKSPGLAEMWGVDMGPRRYRSDARVGAAIRALSRRRRSGA